jgi:hypothetical protein
LKGLRKPDTEADIVHRIGVSRQTIQKVKLELHFTPKHGSWLGIAEIELSALAAQRLGRGRIGDMSLPGAELEASKLACRYLKRCLI